MVERDIYPETTKPGPGPKKPWRPVDGNPLFQHLSYRAAFFTGSKSENVPRLDITAGAEDNTPSISFIINKFNASFFKEIHS
jgi:hypothetical protein